MICCRTGSFLSFFSCLTQQTSVAQGQAREELTRGEDEITQIAIKCVDLKKELEDAKKTQALQKKQIMVITAILLVGGASFITIFSVSHVLLVCALMASGVGIGVAIGVVVLMGIVYLLLKKHFRQTNERIQQLTTEHDVYVSEHHELQGLSDLATIEQKLTKIFENKEAAVLQAQNKKVRLERRIGEIATTLRLKVFNTCTDLRKIQRTALGGQEEEAGGNNKTVTLGDKEQQKERALAQVAQQEIKKAMNTAMNTAMSRFPALKKGKNAIASAEYGKYKQVVKKLTGAAKENAIVIAIKAALIVVNQQYLNPPQDNTYDAEDKALQLLCKQGTAMRTLNDALETLNEESSVEKKAELVLKALSGETEQQELKKVELVLKALSGETAEKALEEAQKELEEAQKELEKAQGELEEAEQKLQAVKSVKATASVRQAITPCRG